MNEWTSNFSTTFSLIRDALIQNKYGTFFNCFSRKVSIQLSTDVF